MDNNNRKEHWENVYDNKQPHEVSWTQDIPEISLSFISSLGLDKHARIIDIGGGDSKLVDYLLDQGYENVTVLDISGKALQRAQERLGERSSKVIWIETDITAFELEEKYDLWHDRAAFHFLTTVEQKTAYLTIAEKAVEGYMIIGTFSEDGPLKCSGLVIQQYAEDSLSDQFSSGFDKIACRTENHTTPFDTVQNFLFCSFRRKA